MKLAKLHEYSLPSLYKFWYLNTRNTQLAKYSSPESFADYLKSKQAIELVSMKGFILCKVTNKTLLKILLKKLHNEPWSLLPHSFFYRLVRLLGL